MRIDVTPEQIAFYRGQGYLAIQQFLDAEELAVWRAAVDEAAARSSVIPGSAEPDEAASASAGPEERRRAAYYDKVFTQRVNLWQTSEAVRAIMLDERLGKVAATLAGVDGVRIWHDQALIKPPWGNPTGFHLDVPYWSFTSPDAITIWVALDDATLENGCLYYVPGTHKARKYENVGIGEEIGALFDVYPEWADIVPASAPVPAGGCVFHNGLIAHGAGANMTPGRRRAMTCAYMPDGATFNGQRNVLPESYFADLTVGDVLDNDEQNPLVYSAAGRPAVS